MAAERPLTAEIAVFAAETGYDDIPDSVIERGRIHVLDALGLGLAGAGAPCSDIARRHVASLGCSGAASVIGATMRTAPRFAAFANGTAIHADNFDDTNPQPLAHRNGGIHATASVLAAALALGEQHGASGRDVEAAYHVGVEIACKLNHAIGARHYEGGFHTTGTLGIFGAAAAAGRLLGLDSGGIEHALAFAASAAGGVRRNFGTLVETMHTGHAAECGVAAAELAALGLTGAEAILEGPVGYFEAAAGGYEPDAIAGRLGTPWAFDDPGMWIKPHPSGALTHPAMTWLQDAVREHDLRPDRIAAVRIRTNRRIANTLIHNRPETGMQAKFSMPFCAAIILLEGKAGLGEFTDAVVGRGDVRAMIDRIDYAAYDRAAADFTNVTTLIEIDLDDGRTISGRADFARGSARLPMRFVDVREKFLGCAAYTGWPADRTDAIVDMVQDLGGAAGVGPLMALMRRGARD